jgi:hypothetical protein
VSSMHFVIHFDAKRFDKGMWKALAKLWLLKEFLERDNPLGVNSETTTHSHVETVREEASKNNTLAQAHDALR